MSLNSNGNSVSNSTDLAALVVPGNIALNTKVWNNEVGASFSYTISTADLDPDVVVAVAGITGARWVKDTTSVADGSITTAKLAASAVTGAKVDATSVTAALDPVTTSLQGAMTAADKVKLNNLTDWRKAMWLFAKGLSSSINVDEFTDLTQASSDYWVNARVAGTTTTQDSNFNGGVVTLSTGASGTSSSLVYPGASSSRGIEVSNIKTAVPWLAAGRVKFNSSADANTQNVIGMANQNGTSGVWFGQDGFSGQTTKLALSCNSLNYNVSTQDVNATFADLIVFFDGTTVYAYYTSNIVTVAPTLVAQQATLTNVPTVSGTVTFQMYQGGTVAAKTANVDCLYWAGARS
jgi:hypothetical protein